MIYFNTIYFQQSTELNKIGCNITEVKGEYLDKITTTLYFVNCPKIQIQLNIFYKRGDYYWIGGDKSKKSYPKYFGDVPRGINK
jgi:hypothetical protein